MNYFFSLEIIIMKIWNLRTCMENYTKSPTLLSRPKLSSTSLKEFATKKHAFSV